MQLIAHLRVLAPKQRERLAARAKTTLGYLWQIAYGHSRCGPNLARRIEKASGGKVRARVLRPDLFGPQ